ncbi:hypothetical protein KAX02_02750 [candidate division WOR-3 bacterium]|nr:hypothetical protein [candidate division WOR-3 bacterium]
MKELTEQADILVKEAEKIVINIGAYSPATRSLGCKKDSLENIQHDVATLMQRYSRLYAEIGALIKERKDV